jgi:hypothetical protein
VRVTLHDAFFGFNKSVILFDLFFTNIRHFVKKRTIKSLVYLRMCFFYPTILYKGTNKIRLSMMDSKSCYTI